MGQSAAGAWVELLGRPGCHLCAALWPEVLAAADSLGIGARMVDIEQDPELHRTFLWRIPVVRLGGGVVAEGRVDPAGLRPKLAAALGNSRVRSGSQGCDAVSGAPRQG